MVYFILSQVQEIFFQCIFSEIHYSIILENQFRKFQRKQDFD
jgi:hypothetical protein